MIKIYMIMNRLNNKKYIGQTTKTIEERFMKHYNSRNEEKFKHLLFRKALREYPIDIWEFKELATTNIREEANRLEKYFIFKYKTYDSKYGYNIAYGGIGGDTLTNNSNLKNISKKISLKLTGSNNFQSKPVRLFNDTENYEFESASLCHKFLIKNGIHIAESSVKRKCNKIIKSNKIGIYFIEWL